MDNLEKYYLFVNQVIIFQYYKREPDIGIVVSINNTQYVIPFRNNDITLNISDIEKIIVSLGEISELSEFHPYLQEWMEYFIDSSYHFNHKIDIDNEIYLRNLFRNHDHYFKFRDHYFKFRERIIKQNIF